MRNGERHAGSRPIGPYRHTHTHTHAHWAHLTKLYTIESSWHYFRVAKKSHVAQPMHSGKYSDRVNHHRLALGLSLKGRVQLHNAYPSKGLAILIFLWLIVDTLEIFFILEIMYQWQDSTFKRFNAFPVHPIIIILPPDKNTNMQRSFTHRHTQTHIHTHTYTHTHTHIRPQSH